MFNKSSTTNFIAIAACFVGWFYQVDWLLAMGLFALSGALTNWIAIHMLFEKVPGLYGSGIIQIKFKQFKAGIKSMIMEQFFTAENFDKFLSAQTNSAQHFDLTPIINDTDMTPAFDSLVATIKQSSFGSMLEMFGGDAALAPLKEPFVDKLKSAVTDITQSDDFADKVKSNISSQLNIDDMIEKVDILVEQRLAELTPEMVKEIIQQMIKSHLGWLVIWGGVFGGVIGLITHLLSM